LVETKQVYRELYLKIYVLFFLLRGVRNTYFVVRQQCEGNPLLNFHGNIEHFCIVDS